MLVDTDVLIRHLRGYAQATRRLDRLGSLTLSAVSHLEVRQGMRNKAELAAVKKMLDRHSVTLLPVTGAITQRAIALLESLALSHGLQMGDALIATTALEHGLPILTANLKHFAAVEGFRGRGVCALSGGEKLAAKIQELTPCFALLCASRRSG